MDVSSITLNNIGIKSQLLRCKMHDSEWNKLLQVFFIFNRRYFCYHVFIVARNLREKILAFVPVP